MTLGEKIKKRRLELGITQKELADAQMTRNMVSEIESDHAQPSLANLLYLANKLDVSPAYLIDAAMTPIDDKKARFEHTLERLFRSKKYADCISYADAHLEGLYDSTLSYLLACACLYEAENASVGGSVNRALALLERMQKHAEETDFDTTHLRLRALLCHALASDPLTPHYALDEASYADMVSHLSGEESYHYLRGDLTYPYESPVLHAHIEAKQLMREHRYTEAITVLNHLLERRLTEQISLLIIYRVYSDLETCYRERKDYENAYKFAGKKHSLFSSFKS